MHTLWARSVAHVKCKRFHYPMLSPQRFYFQFSIFIARFSFIALHIFIVFGAHQTVLFRRKRRFSLWFSYFMSSPIRLEDGKSDILFTVATYPIRSDPFKYLKYSHATSSVLCVFVWYTIHCMQSTYRTNNQKLIIVIYAYCMTAWLMSDEFDDTKI